MTVLGVSKLERFFRVAASLDVDKDDLKRFDEFLDRKVRDLLLRGQAVARANNRQAIEPYDLPITKGLQQNIHDFRALDEASLIRPVLSDLIPRPLLDLPLSDATDTELLDIAGGLSLALARVIRVINPQLKNPQSHNWEQVMGVFEQLV